MGKYLKDGESAYNYNEAKDGNISWMRSILTKMANNVHPNIPTGLSNCTLTATQWVNPKNPLMRAATIINNPGKQGFYEVDKDNAIEKDLVIASNERTDPKPKYHTMMISGFQKDGEPLVNYSAGLANKESIRLNKPLNWYTERSHGKDLNRFYRYINENEVHVNMPNITVTPKGNSFEDKPFKYIKR